MSFGSMKMMNDKEFRQKCREISYANIEDYMEGASERQHLVSTRKENVDILKTAALLYIAANMSNSNEKPCKFCSDDAKHDTTISHYLYIDSKHKQLVDVCDGIVTRAAIKYCPMCSRKL